MKTNIKRPIDKEKMEKWGIDNQTYFSIKETPTELLVYPTSEEFPFLKEPVSASDLSIRFLRTFLFFYQIEKGVMLAFVGLLACITAFLFTGTIAPSSIRFVLSGSWWGVLLGLTALVGFTFQWTVKHSDFLYLGFAYFHFANEGHKQQLQGDTTETNEKIEDKEELNSSLVE